jgi:parvulin-like peptidyl-prolyl isomerase
MPIKVNGETIPDAAIQYEFDRLVRFYSDHMSPAKIKEQTAMLRKRAADQAVGAKLLFLEAERLDIRVSPDEVDARVNQLIAQAGGAARFEELLRKQNLGVETIRAGIERGRRVDLLVERATSEVSEPTEAELQAHFAAHEEEYAKPERAQAQHILVKPESDTPAAHDAAKAKLLDIRRRLEQGAKFAELAAAYSDCPSGRKAGGSLGWVSRGMMVPEFDEALFALRVGELSGVVKTGFGYHLVHKTAQEPGGPATLADVSNRIRDFLRHVRRGEALSAYVNELRAKATVEGL